MGRRSTKENKNIYQTSREALGYSREAASEKLNISADRIERIENEKCLPHPDEILSMVECYKNPALCNYFCSRECPIGQKYVPEVKSKELSIITLEILAALNSLTNGKERLVEITVDGKITDNEIADFRAIQENLNKMSQTIDSLNLWMSHTILSGKL